MNWIQKTSDTVQIIVRRCWQFKQSKTLNDFLVLFTLFTILQLITFSLFSYNLTPKFLYCAIYDHLLISESEIVISIFPTDGWPSMANFSFILHMLKSCLKSIKTTFLHMFCPGCHSIHERSFQTAFVSLFAHTALTPVCFASGQI